MSADRESARRAAVWSLDTLWAYVFERTTRGLRRAAFVAVMEPADFGQLDDLTHRRGLDFSWVRGVLVQREVRSRGLVVADVGTEDATEMCLSKDDHVVVLNSRHL